MFGNESYIIANICHPYFGRIGTIENKDSEHLIFHSRELSDPDEIIVEYSDIERLA